MNNTTDDKACEPTAQEREVERQRMAHWPYAAGHAQRHFNPQRIEQQAVRILARGLRTQRLLAFVGAGASMAYGRLTWAQLMESLFQQLDQRFPMADSEWQRTSSLLWDRDLKTFLSDGNHMMKAQILADIAEREEAPGSSIGGSPVHRVTSALLRDHQGFVDQLIWQLLPDTAQQDYKRKGGAKTKGLLQPGTHKAERLMGQKDWSFPGRGQREELESKQLSLEGDPNPMTSGLAAVAEVLAAQGAQFLTLEAAQDPESPLIKGVLEGLRKPTIAASSPIRLLAVDWGIRRYITTNYDHEIERSLRAVGFRHSDDRPVHENTYEELDFGRSQTGQALCFGLDGPRRNAQVLHLHGDVDAPESLVLTEADYRRLYLEDHAQRDLVNNTTSANLAANPVLFVGSDVNEDDVLRPMRQFMSGSGHRRDRMAVAVFLATKDHHKRAQRKLELLLKYGVYAVHVGRVGPEATSARSPTGSEPGEEAWLYRLNKIKGDVLGQLRILEPSPGATPPRARDIASATKELRSLLADLQRLGIPSIIEGQLAIESSEFCIARPLDLMQQALLQLLKDLNTPKVTRVTRFHLVKLRLLSEVGCNHIMGVFVCARLVTLHQQALELVRKDMSPVASFRRPLRLRVQGQLHIDRRHPVSVERPGMVGRFNRIHLAGFNERIGDLCAHIRGSFAFTHHPFSTHPGRRLIVVCSARGVGKGGQFDRLALEKGRPRGGYWIEDVLTELNPLGHRVEDSTVLHLNLAFSDELGAVIDQVTSALHQLADTLGVADSRGQPACKDQIEMLERGLSRLAGAPRGHRVTIVLGNAGVLFDHVGRPKNGQISRVLRLFRGARYAAVPVDVLMYVGESQMPAPLRSLSLAHKEARQAAPVSKPVADDRLRRRLERLNITTQPQHDTLVHPLGKTRFTELAEAYFPGFVDGLRQAEALLPRQPGEEWQAKFGQFVRDLFFGTGGSRFAQTVLIAYLEAVRLDLRWAQALEVLSRLKGAPAGAGVEYVIEMVLDGWARLHLLGQLHPRCLPDRVGRDALALHQRMAELASQPCAAQWALATELMWHLSAFAHPVEVNVLMFCPGVQAAVTALPDRASRAINVQSLARDIEAVLELLVHRCLVFRIAERVLPTRSGSDDAPPAPTAKDMGSRWRYTLHRHMQRHFLRLMGGRNVETTYWDQFTTSMYASQPDEAPCLRPPVQRTLTTVVQRLTHYPAVAEEAGAVQPHQVAPHTEVRMLQEADRLRAAYYLIRSTYSLGVISHLLAHTSDETNGLGHMEHYRRLVRWVTHAAQYWEDAYVDERKRYLCTDTPALGVATKPMGVFHAGELVWLYNEAGIISLAQGKLQDAEQMLSMAEHAARKIEGDDSGSIHTRIRLHTALTQIERGRPHQARQILRPISMRQGGHPVPPLIAQFYLGLLEHIGGNYRTAQDHYDTALMGLRTHERSRATAFVLMAKADLEQVLNPGAGDAGFALSEEAISLAQQGGHEDLRVLATLARVRIHLDARSQRRNDAFEQLSHAERYATGMDMPRIACEVHELRARLLLLQGEYRLSAAEVTASLEIAALYDLKLMKARGLLTLANIYHRRGEIDGARALLRMGKDIAASADYYSCVRGFQDLEIQLNAAPPTFGPSLQ